MKTTQMKRITSFLIAASMFLVLLTISNTLLAQGKPSAAEVAAKMANPTTAPAAMTHNFDFTTFQGDLTGASDQTGFTYLFQPTIPLSSKSPRFTFRPAVPVMLNQPVINSESGNFESEFALGDIGFDLVYGTTFKSGFLLSGGLLGSIPTATGDYVGSGQLQVGPNVLLGIARKWGVIGALAGHKWGITGPGDKANATVATLFITFPFGDGTWQVTSLPVISANHNLEEQKWSIPVNIGIAKALTLGESIFRVNAGYSYYLVTPEAFAPEGVFRLMITKVVNVSL